jgi:hypothetical protein
LIISTTEGGYDYHKNQIHLIVPIGRCCTSQKLMKLLIALPDPPPRSGTADGLRLAFGFGAIRNFEHFDIVCTLGILLGSADAMARNARATKALARKKRAAIGKIRGSRCAPSVIARS